MHISFFFKLSLVGNIRLWRLHFSSFPLLNHSFHWLPNKSSQCTYRIKIRTLGGCAHGKNRDRWEVNTSCSPEIGDDKKCSKSINQDHLHKGRRKGEQRSERGKKGILMMTLLVNRGEHYIPQGKNLIQNM